MPSPCSNRHDYLHDLLSVIDVMTATVKSVSNLESQDRKAGYIVGYKEIKNRIVAQLLMYFSGFHVLPTN